MSKHKLSELAQRTIDDIDANPVCNYCRLSIKDAIDIRDRAAAVEKELAVRDEAIELLALECAKALYGQPREWVVGIMALARSNITNGIQTGQPEVEGYCCQPESCAVKGNDDEAE